MSNKGFPGGSVRRDLPAIKETTCNAGDLNLILGLGRSPGEGNGNSLQYFCLRNPMNRGTCRATVQGVTKELDMNEQLNNNKVTLSFGYFAGSLKVQCTKLCLLPSFLITIAHGCQHLCFLSPSSPFQQVS